LSTKHKDPLHIRIRFEKINRNKGQKNGPVLEHAGQTHQREMRINITTEKSSMHCKLCNFELTSDQQIHGRNYCDNCLLKIDHDGKVSVFATVKKKMEDLDNA
jgi:hypothetical protein|tara:strand:- start:288 stop:596 length:309 start_codon:yes stop_codon:yes gene_type:complete